jgi:hypothetical protein
MENGGMKKMKKPLLITMCGMVLAMPGITLGNTDWIQGVWNCEQYSSNPAMQCQAQGQTKFSGSQYESQTTMECNTGSMQASTWGTYSLKGKGNLWSITYKPQGAVPPTMKLKPSTKTIEVSADRRIITSKVTSRLQDGSQMSEESRCQKSQ